jgi:hypothetical protein
MEVSNPKSDISDDYENTVLWAIEEEKKRLQRGNGYNLTYLLILFIIIFLVVLFILYFANRKKKGNALDMIRDPRNLFEEFSQDDEGIPLIDISEDHVATEEPNVDGVVEPLSAK